MQIADVEYNQATRLQLNIRLISASSIAQVDYPDYRFDLRQVSSYEAEYEAEADGPLPRFSKLFSNHIDAAGKDRGNNYVAFFIPAPPPVRAITGQYVDLPRH